MKRISIYVHLIMAAAFVSAGLLISSCSKQTMAKNFGGTDTINLPAGQRFLCATREEDHLWYATRPRHEDERPETVTMRESSSFGVYQGTIVFQER